MANARLEFSSDARRDLLLIDSRSAHDWGVDRANRNLRSLNRACDRLADFPESGRARPDLGDVRSFPVEQHLILYRSVPSGVLIVRVIHQRMRLSEVDLP